MTNLHPRKKRRILSRAAAIGLMFSLSYSQATESSKSSSVIDSSCSELLSHKFRPLMGPSRQRLCDDHQGKVLLVVNTASRCGFTPQFDSLQRLFDTFKDQGFSILGFPSDDFRQELGSEEAVAEFCQLNYGVNFPMYQKVNVTSPDAHPLFAALAHQSGFPVKWNFNKYLIDQSGQVIHYFPSHIDPLSPVITNKIEALLGSS